MSQSVIDIDGVWNFSDPAASERGFTALLENPDVATEPALEAEVLTQLARAQGLQRRFEEAHATLDRAEKLLTVGESRAQARYLLERGRVFNSSGDPTRGRALFEQAWLVARAIGDHALAIDAAHMLGIVESGAESLSWNEKALALARSSEQPGARRWLASLYNNIGWSYHESGRYEDALEMLEQALAERERRPERGPLLAARWAVARALRSLGRHEEALDRQRELLDEHARDGTHDGYVQEELGENLLALGRAEEARAHFARAHELLSGVDGLAAGDPERLRRLAELGSIGNQTRAASRA